MKFNIEDYKGSYVMHCKTEEETKDFCGYLDSINRKWISGLSYEDNTKWDVHKQDTYYYFNEGCFSNGYFVNKYRYKIIT